jgi:hypothetical protein
MAAQRVIFARVGWMKRYEGPSPNDPGPVRGGAYNEARVGSEAVNFKPLAGKFYGFFQSPAKGNAVDLSRVDPAASGDSLSDVRIVWVATRDDVGQVVVGWYDNATLLAKAHDYPEESGREEYIYKCIADPANAVLLPVSERAWVVPKGRNGMGEANILYPIGDDGRSRLQTPGFEWMTDILAKIDLYESSTDEEPVADAVAAAATGQGFLGDPAWRRALEEHAMNAAIRYLHKEGYDPKDEHKTHPYDLRCTKGPEILFVEVKGTTTAGESVFVTSGEVGFARKNAPNTALFILHSGQRDGSGKPVGGNAVMLRPWKPSDDSLSPIAYTYTRT